MGIHYLLPEMNCLEASSVADREGIMKSTAGEIPEDYAAYAIQVAVKSAAEDGRLILGFLDSATVIQQCPQRVCICLIAEDAQDDDIAFNIHQTLLKAYCYEIGIAVINVKNLSRLLEENIASQMKQCVLITMPHNCSESTTAILSFLKGIGCTRSPTIEVPG